MVEELKRKIEGLKGHQKEGMTTQRAWNWHLDEMRAAAKVDDPLLDETLDETLEDISSSSKVASFTPINHPGYSDTVPIDSGLENATIQSTAADKPRSQKRRRAQPSAASKASKLKKAMSTTKTKRVKTAAQLDCQDISQGLSRTKPTSPGYGALHAKSRLLFGDTSLQRDLEQRSIGDTPVESEVKPAPPGLTDRYQAAFPKSWRNALEHATPPTPPGSDEVDPETCHQSCDPDSATERQASPDVCIERPVAQDQGYDGSTIVRDFGAPPYTQTSPRTLQGSCRQGIMTVDMFEPPNSMSNDLFDVSDIEHGDIGGEDEFPVDDECLEEMLQSTWVQGEEEPLCSDCPPQDFSDENTLYCDEQPRNDQSHFFEAIANSDREAIYDEGPSLVINDPIDVPSSPSWSSQASCILTRVTGNAVPHRARTAEGSENCFDDQDLDDSLIDLTVQESKSGQAASPVTPPKRPSTPKLQWLPPKTYTPGNSSQISKSPTNDSRLTPVTSNLTTLPFIRPPFPKPIRDRSPILGLSNRTVLRTCFRIGEALNAAAVASRTNVDAVTELYARVVTSSREGYKQFFQFGDLFTDKPPYLGGTYTLWKGVELWDVDSKKLVGDEGRGKMVRVLGRIKRKEPVQGQASGVEMMVLSIWEVDWEDVGVAKGIVCA